MAEHVVACDQENVIHIGKTIQVRMFAPEGYVEDPHLHEGVTIYNDLALGYKDPILIGRHQIPAFVAAVLAGSSKNLSPTFQMWDGYIAPVKVTTMPDGLISIRFDQTSSWTLSSERVKWLVEGVMTLMAQLPGQKHSYDEWMKAMNGE